MSAPIFHFDVGSPYAYLAAERIERVLSVAPIWQPVLVGALFKRLGTTSWAFGPGRAGNIAEIERRASSYGLPPLRWPEAWPSSTLHAMRVATWAARQGRGREFALAAFRRTFVLGEDLSLPASVAKAAVDARLDPDAALAAAASEPVKQALRQATEHAGDLGVRGVPSVVVGAAVFFGDDRLAAAAPAARAG
jgi:2-hydroxychromene-2-carboxylate isomerase